VPQTHEQKPTLCPCLHQRMLGTEYVRGGGVERRAFTLESCLPDQAL